MRFLHLTVHIVAIFSSVLALLASELQNEAKNVSRFPERVDRISIQRKGNAPNKQINTEESKADPKFENGTRTEAFEKPTADAIPKRINKQIAESSVAWWIKLRTTIQPKGNDPNKQINVAERIADPKFVHGTRTEAGVKPTADAIPEPETKQVAESRVARVWSKIRRTLQPKENAPNEHAVNAENVEESKADPKSEEENITEPVDRPSVDFNPEAETKHVAESRVPRVPSKSRITIKSGLPNEYPPNAENVDQTKSEDVDLIPKSSSVREAETKDVAESKVARVASKIKLNAVPAPPAVPDSSNDDDEDPMNAMWQKITESTTPKPKKKKVGSLWSRYCNSNLEIPKPWCWQI